MSAFGTPSYSTRGTTLKIGVGAAAQVIGGLTGISGLGGGSRNEIDITGLNSGAREYILGFADPGTLTADGVLAAQSDMAQRLDDLQESDVASSFSITLPAQVNADTGLAENTALEVESFVGSVAAAGAGEDVVITGKTASQFEQLVPISTGDYVKWVVSSNDRFVRITKVALDAMKKLVLTGKAEPATQAIVVAADANLSIMRPPVRIDFNAQVSRFSRDFASEDAARFSLELRVTGKPTTTIGTPDLA